MNVFYKSKIVVCINGQNNIVDCKIIFDETKKNDSMDKDIETLLKTVIVSDDISTASDEIYKKIPPQYLSVKVSIEIETENGGYEVEYPEQNNSVNVITDSTGNVKGIITNKLGSVNVISIDGLNNIDKNKILGQLSGPSPQDGSPPPQENKPKISNKGSLVTDDNIKNFLDKIDKFCPDTGLIDDLPNSDDPKWVSIRQQIQNSKDNGDQNANTTN